jgi:hypothetical protein
MRHHWQVARRGVDKRDGQRWDRAYQGLLQRTVPAPQSAVAFLPPGLRPDQEANHESSDLYSRLDPAAGRDAHERTVTGAPTELCDNPEGGRSQGCYFL